MHKAKNIIAAIGTVLSVTGVATATTEVLQIISLIVTIIGAIISFILVPLWTWYMNAKKDGKITLDEIKDATDIIKDGIDHVAQASERKDDGPKVIK